MKIEHQAIENIVRDYLALFPKEFDAFKTAIAEKKHKTENKFGLLKNTDTEMRALYEIPGTLQVMFERYLDNETLKFMETKAGSRWFSKRFTEFSLAETV